MDSFPYEFTDYVLLYFMIGGIFASGALIRVSKKLDEKKVTFGQVISSWIAATIIWPYLMPKLIFRIATGKND